MGRVEKTVGFQDIAPSGYYLAVRVGFAFPVLEENKLPEEWVKIYTEQGFMLSDPVMKWVYAHTGAIRWSEMALEDPRAILEQARKYRLNYGVAISHMDPDQEGLRSFAWFAHPQREFTDVEIEHLQQQIVSLHQAKAPPSNLTKAEKEVLVMVKEGLLLKEMAAILGISEGAIKQRLKNAKLKLGAKTSAHAATLSLEYGLI